MHDPDVTHGAHRRTHQHGLQRLHDRRCSHLVLLRRPAHRLADRFGTKCFVDAVRGMSIPIAVLIRFQHNDFPTRSSAQRQ
jgi:hypothetical protein